MLKLTILIWALSASTLLLRAQPDYKRPPNEKYLLDSVVTATYKLQNCQYHFARIYQLVGNGVNELKKRGQIQDTAFINELERHFLNHYIQNINHYNTGLAASQSWSIALDTTTNPTLFINSILLSINAHINHDLFLTLSACFKNKKPTPINKQDYERVAAVHTTIMYAYAYNLIKKIGSLRKWETQAIQSANAMASKFLKTERELIWRRAVKAAKNERKYKRYCRRQEKKTLMFARRIIKPRGVQKKLITIIAPANAWSFADKASLLEF